MIFSKGVMTTRQKGESINQHIIRQEKEAWINQYRYIGDSSRKEAEEAFNRVFKTNRDFVKYVSG